MRLRRLDSVGVMVAVSLITLFQPTLHAQQNAGFGGKAAQAVPGPAAPPGLTEGVVGGDGATPGWYDGSINSQWGVNCLILGGAYEEIMLQSMVGYWGTSDLSYPRVGERYWGRVFLSVPGNACADGLTDAYLWIRLPPDTHFAITPEFPVQCFYSSASTGGSFVNITNDPAAACPHNPSGPDGGGWYFLNARNLAQGMMFQIQFPIYSTKVKNGISDANAQMTAGVSSSDTPNTATRPNNDPQYPYQWVWVAANPPTVSYPAPSALNITNTTARTVGWIFNHFTSGNIYFDIGQTTAYGTSLGPLAIANTYDAAEAYQDWISLIPGTPYHWRVRFVHGGGTVLGANQTFTTTGTPPGPSGFVRGDFSGDGKPDLVWRNSTTGAVNVWFLNGTSYVGGANLFTVADANWHLAGTGDFNGDAKTDLVWRNSATGAVNVWFLNGTAYLGGANLFNVADANWKIAVVGDYNGDGKDDLIWRNHATGAVNAWFLNGTSYIGGSSLFTVADLNWSLEVGGDFNGDGKNDLIWRNYATGAVNVWFMNGTTYVGGASLFNVAGSAWKIQASGDYSGDGKRDLIWRNSTTGAVNAWFLNGTAYSGGASLFTVPSEWNIAGPR